MMVFRAAALLFALSAAFTVCQSAHSDRARQRSGPIRSVPIAADIKRDNNFDCPEEFGYYPHPTDCTQYYVCVFGGALLESCTGGLMYSHELQTCDWPRNVGCDAIGTGIDGEELERVIEKKQPPPAPAPPPRRVPPPLPPPPPRAQPNPIITSRGQPKFNRDEYEKQQQLYAEVDDLPPVEEIESDRQQRVYRGQPSTIGQVQRDRDGYAQVSSGRTHNSNIIPASIPQNNGKIGSFSFGSQVEERRPTATPAPQSYSEDKSNLTDAHNDRQPDVETNVIDDKTLTETSSRQKRETAENILFTTDNLTLTENNATLESDVISNKNDGNFEDYVETETEFNSNENYDSTEESERDKRQVRHGRYYLKNGYIKTGKNWANPKPSKLIDIPQFNYNIPTNSQNTRYQPAFNSLNHNSFPDGTRKPNYDESLFSTANTFLSYPTEVTNGPESQKPFKASALDPSTRKQTYNPANAATQIITKSPPISALTKNQNPFATFAGFYNNSPKQNNKQNNNQFSSQILSYNHRPSTYNSFVDSSQLPSTVVTGKPISTQSTRTPTKHRTNQQPTKSNIEPQDVNDQNHHTPYNHKPNPPTNDDDTSSESVEDDVNSSEENSSEKDDEHFKHDFPEPPREFTHPSNKFADIKNPFADPNFDFDAFIAKLSGENQKPITVSTRKPNYAQNFKTTNPQVEGTTASPPKSGVRTSTLNYHGMSTPRPFSATAEEALSWTVPNPTKSITKQPLKFEQFSQRPSHQQDQESYRQQQRDQGSYRQQQQDLGSYRQQQQDNESYRKQQQDQENYRQQQHQHHQKQQQQQQQQQSTVNENMFNRFQQQNTGIPLEAIRPKLKPPNFNDDRQLPINYNFNQGSQNTIRPPSEQNHYESNSKNKQEYSVTQNPYVFVSSTRPPIYLSTPKQQFVNIQPQYTVTGKPYLVSSIKPQNEYYSFKHSTTKPLTTIANQQLTALQNFWNGHHSTIRPTAVTEISNLENLFRQAIKSTVQTNTNGNKHNIIIAYTPKEQISSTTKVPTTRRPIPKPSPEMNDYYYDEDEQYYYEPPVKSQYMPSTEIRPQRPLMAQNYQEYEDDSYEDNSSENSPQKPSFRRPANYNTYKTDADTNNHNDVAIITKTPQKNLLKSNVKHTAISFNSVTPAPNVLQRPEVTNYKVLHYPQRNKTMHIKRPESGPNTVKPPKYLNQTTLRPYTVRHRLAKPTTVRILMTQTTQSQEAKPTRGPTRHPNIVTQTRVTTPRDSHNQETRYTKTRHDDRTNSLEPTESVTPTPFSPSPRPKMLYNGSQSYNPDQFDPYYAVYDEDGELYKDTDYVQQYNLASLRPAVQQTYRGTPPPVRRPVETYTARPVTVQDYDDALLQGQINNQNQYETPIRHSTRGEGNDLEYDNNPSSVRTTIYEATSISTTPSTTTSTSTTTTQRPTVARITEAMTPSRFTTRSSTDANPVQNPDSPSFNRQTSNSESHYSIPSTTPPVVNFSSLAKPFERTDNIYRLRDKLTSTERLPTPTQKASHVSNNNKLETVRINSNQDDKKVVSLTSGFSIRRNSNNTNNPYTLTVLTRPFENYVRSRETSINKGKGSKQDDSNRYFYDNDNVNEEEFKTPIQEKGDVSHENETTSDRSSRRTDSSPEIISEERDFPLYVRPTAKLRIVEPKYKTPTPSTTTTASKFFLKTVIKRPVPFSYDNEQSEGSTDNNIDTAALIEKAYQNSQYTINDTKVEDFSQWDQYDQSKESYNEPIVGPYETLNNLRSSYTAEDDHNVQTITTTSAPSYIPTTPKFVKNQSDIDRSSQTSVKPTYYTYRVIDDHVQPDHTTEFFNTKAKSLLKAFFNNLVSSPKTQPQVQIVRTTLRPTAEPEKVVNIGFHKKYLRFDDEKPLKNNVQRLQIITEPGVSRYVTPTIESIAFTDSHKNSDVSSTVTFAPVTQIHSETETMTTESTTKSQYRVTPSREMYDSRFSTLITSENPNNQYSSKFRNIITEKPLTESITKNRGSILFNNEDNELTRLTGTNFESNKETEIEHDGHIDQFTSTTTSTTKATTTVKYVEPTTSTKSLSFPTRASRVNPAIKLAAANPGGGRRSYQSSSKCSSDNSLQENPKCNEIKYQRPSLPTRGRGSAHYSTLNGNEAPQQQTSNRGTPPTRSRPTLKPSTAIVSKSTEFVDIYSYPPRRPGPVYPQPTPDKTAAKCRKDVCLLPDCYCGGKDIPGELPVESVPQIVLLTFDDSVNDLNKVLYSDLFDKGRVNPNGCPISATFYVSHEWTDYSQVQNLYAAGHEMASHTISHSFGEQFSQKKWNREVGGQREILAAYGGVKLEDVRGMRAPFLSVGGNKMFKMLYDSNFTYDSSMPVYENRPPSWPYTLDYKLFHDCMIPPCPTKSYPGVWEVPMVMWQDLNGGRCSMGDACANPPNAEGVYKMLLKNFDRHYTTNRAPFGLFYHAAWFTQPHHKEGFIMFMDFINRMNDVYIVTNWQALQWVRDPTPINRLNNFQPFQCDYPDRPKKCNNPKVCNLWHKSGVRYMRTCQPCPEVYPWTGKTGIRSSRIDNDIEE